MIRRYLILFGILLVMGSVVLFARTGSGFQLSLDLGMGLPGGEFKENLDRSVLFPALSADFGWTIPKTSLTVGINGGYFSMGQETRYQYHFFPEFGDVEFEITDSHELWQLFFYLRFQLESNLKIKPYVEVLTGWLFMSTSSSIPAGTDYDESDNTFVSTTHHKDSAFGYGAGAGILFKISGKRNSNRDVWKEKHFIHLGVRYTTCENVEYVPKGSLLVEDDQVTIWISESNVQLFTVFLGWSFHF